MHEVDHHKTLNVDSYHLARPLVLLDVGYIYPQL